MSAPMVAKELRRRRVGRRSMAAALDRAGQAVCTWVPGDLDTVPTPLLVLAAMSLTRTPHLEPVR